MIYMSILHIVYTIHILNGQVFFGHGFGFVNHLQVRDIPKSKHMKVQKEKQKKKDTIVEESKEKVVAQLEHKVVYEVC